MIPRMTDDELRKFVDDFCSDRIYSLAHMRPETARQLASIVFMPVGMGAVSESDAKDVGMIWEYMSEATPRSINGMPMFMSCRLMHKDDWKRAAAAIVLEDDRRKTEIKL